MDCAIYAFLVDKAEDLASNVLATSLLVIHNASRGGKDQVTELTGRKEVVGPGLKLAELDVEARRDNTNLVQTTIQENDNLTRAVVVDPLEILNVA